MLLLRTLCVVFLYSTFLSSSLSGQYIGGDRYLATHWANDVLFLPKKTDRYFTSGQVVTYGRYRKEKFPFLKTGQSLTHRYWTLRQHIYTPENITSADFLEKDRPYASYLVLNRGRSIEVEKLGLSLLTEWTAGVLGKYSFGGKIQNSWHDLLEYADYVPGWHHEVKSDLILNYRLRIGQNMTPGSRFSLRPRLEFQLGSLYTNAAVGLLTRLVPVRITPRRQFRLELFADARLVGYDATLSGGLFNRDDRYRGVVQPKRITGRANFNGFIEYDGWQVQGGVSAMSAEFVGGKSHIWAWIGVQTAPRYRR